MKNILVIRLSSIGDIVLCTPILRALKTQTGASITVISKKAYSSVLKGNPYVDRLEEYEASKLNGWENLKEKNFDLILDLHKNIRSRGIIQALRKPYINFKKRNFDKWLLVNFKLNRLSEQHIVYRYFDAVRELGVRDDGEGLDFYVSEEATNHVRPYLPKKNFLAVAMGAAWSTKAIPHEKIVDILNNIECGIVLIGGPKERSKGQKIIANFPQREIVNLCGDLTIEQSGAVIKNSTVLLTPDTGMMHIGAALKKPMVVMWGSTVADFGMYPFYGNHDIVHYNMELKLPCRPCSKIGFENCPKGHFDCMIGQDHVLIAQRIQELINRRA